MTSVLVRLRQGSFYLLASDRNLNNRIINNLYMQKLKVIIALLAAFAIDTVHAQTKIEVVSLDGNVASSYDLADVRKVTFGENVLGIVPNAGTTVPFSISLGNVRVLKFVEATSIGSLSANNEGIEIFYNQDLLSVKGLSGIARAVIYGIDGSVLYDNHKWNGSSISTAYLPKGVYVFIVNNQSFKFVKR